MDLFEQYDKLPLPIQNIINNQGEIESYDDCRELLDKLSVFGYTFEYGLDAVPHNLREIKEFVDVLTIKDFDDVVTDEDGHKWSQVCVGHAEQMTSECDVQPYGSGICGVEGCDVESEHYIDFSSK